MKRGENLLRPICRLVIAEIIYNFCSSNTKNSSERSQQSSNKRERERETSELSW